MAMRFRILGTGSSGNCAVLHTEQARVLVDAGFSCRRLQEMLATSGDDLARIDAIFLPHEHGDHAAALDGLKRFPHIRVYANRATARALQSGLKHEPAWQVFETGTRFTFRDLEVETVSVPHDAPEPVAFRFSHGHEGDLFSPRRSLAWLTDLGHAPLNVRTCIRDCDLVVLESNHCPTLLQADTRRPWSTKQRISGRHGHLSNQAACELVTTVASPRWRQVFLTHLSSDCNTRAAVEAAFAPARAILPSCTFSVLEPGEGTPFHDLA